MSIKDIIKNSFLEGIGYSAPSLKNIIISIAVAILVGVYIYAIYKLVAADGFYSERFNLSLILTTVITASIILTIQSSVIVSLGMVGALSIVRFRTAVKDPMDLAFLFWAISGGIIAGTGMVGLIVLSSVVITVILVLFKVLKKARSKDNVFISIHADKETDVKQIEGLLKDAGAFFRIQSRNLSRSGLSIIVETRLSDPDAIMKKIDAIEGVRSISIVSGGENTTK